METVLKLYTYIDGINDVPFPNEEFQVAVSEFRCDYKRMGAVPTISCTIMHQDCLDNAWTDNVYAMFNGERFFIKQTPTSSFDNNDTRYRHDLELVSERVILDNVYVYDVVSSDEEIDIPVSNTSKFSFFGTINEFAQRLNYSLSYSKLDYKIVVEEGVSSEGKLVSFENKIFSEALQEIYNIYEIPYSFEGKVIHVGFTNNTIEHTFKYGASESLLSIQKQNANAKIINRITGLGSSDNISYYYPNIDEKGVVSLKYNGLDDVAYISNVYKFRKVKLSDVFSYHDLGEGDVYVGWVRNYKETVNIEDYGIGLNQEPVNGDEISFERISYIQPQPKLMPSIYRESLGKERFYNAENEKYIIPNSDVFYKFNNPYIEGKPKEYIIDFEDIKPSIKGLTNSDGLRIDMFSEFAFDLNDNDDTDDDGNYLHPYFFGKLRKFDGENGFNLFDHSIDENEMVISMTSGSCGSCEFVIGVDDNQKNTVQVDEDGNLLRDEYGDVRCGREGKPVERPQEKQNDTFNNEVWIALKKDNSTFGVLMPNALNNYKPNVEDTFVILHIDLPNSYIIKAEKKLEEELIKYMSLNNDEIFTFSISFSRIFFEENPEILASLNENSRIRIEYNGYNYELYVSSFSYAMTSGSPLPEIKVELEDKITINQNALQTAINNIKNDVVNNIGSVDLLKQGLKHFLRKDIDDVAKGKITFEKEIKSKDFVQGKNTGAGWSSYRDPNGNAVFETDKIVVRQSLDVNEIIVNQETFNRGSITYVKGGCTITNVEEHDDFYRCYYDNEEGKRYSGFRKDDQAKCQRYDTTYTNVIKYYWRLVVGVGSNYVDLSKTDCDGTGIPEEGDDITQLGNRTDKERQSAIVVSPDDGGKVMILAGINEFNLSEKNMIGMGVNPNTGRAYIYGYGDMYFGDRNLKKNYITFQTKNGETEPTLEINADIHLGEDSTGLSNLAEFKSVEDEIQHIQENVNTLGVDVGVIKEQIDREFTIWYFDPIPTLENEPAVNWNTPELVALHDQDLYFSDSLARAWRFVGGVWIEITDERTLAALRIAQGAHDAAEEAKEKAKEAKDYIDAVLPAELESLQKQIDGSIDSYFYEYDPTLDNEPALSWDTDSEKKAHLNDTFTNLQSGRSWRWTVAEEVYAWTEIADTATVEALRLAGQAQDTADNKRRVFVDTPYTPYDIGDLWVQGESGDILRCAVSKDAGDFETAHWVKASKYTDDSELVKFVNGKFKQQIENIQSQIDKRAETWYQSEDPSLQWTDEETKNLHVGDLWYDTNRDQSFMWNGTEWVTQGVPDEVFDKIDGKASIYTSQPSSYNKNDLWVLAEDTTLDAAYKAGTIVIAIESSEVFVKEHWTKKDSYTDDTEADKANTRLESWASDGSISPTEKTALKQQKLDIQGEYNSLLISAVTYGIDVESFSEAYELAVAALAKYTASTPENITIGYDYQNIEAYYQARQELRASIDAAIKMESDKAYKEAVEARGDAKTIKEDMDGIQADMDIIKAQTDMEYVIWYFDEAPTLDNEPAVNWTTDELKALHDQDIYFSDVLARAWRFVNGEWIEITDERTLAALREASDAKKLAESANQKITDMEYLKTAFGKDERVLEGGIIMSKIVSVTNTDTEVEAFLNGSDFAKDETHGKLLLAGGIPSEGENLKDRAKNAATKLYEDGHFVSRSAEIEGKILVGTLEYKVLTEPGGDLTGYSMAIAPEGYNGTFTLPDIADGNHIEIKVIWLQHSRIATDYSVVASNESTRILASSSSGLITELSSIIIEPNKIYKFVSAAGNWFVSTENLLVV